MLPPTAGFVRLQEEPATGQDPSQNPAEGELFGVPAILIYHPGLKWFLSLPGQALWAGGYHRLGVRYTALHLTQHLSSDVRVCI